MDRKISRPKCSLACIATPIATDLYQCYLSGIFPAYLGKAVYSNMKIIETYINRQTCRLQCIIAAAYQRPSSIIKNGLLGSILPMRSTILIRESKTFLRLTRIERGISVATTLVTT